MIVFFEVPEAHAAHDAVRSRVNQLHFRIPHARRDALVRVVSCEGGIVHVRARGIVARTARFQLCHFFLIFFLCFDLK